MSAAIEQAILGLLGRNGSFRGNGLRLQTFCSRRAGSFTHQPSFMPVDLPHPRPITRHEIEVAPPYRLDLTVNALRRLPSNVVDLFTPEGVYMRVLGSAGAPILIQVRQLRADRLLVAIGGDPPEPDAILATVRSILGVDRDLSSFEGSARSIAWLAPLIESLRGVKPPRYPTLWETCVNTIAFQQVSLHAASAVTRRLVVALGERVEIDGEALYLFPEAERVLAVDDDRLRAFGLSVAKVATLRRVGGALSVGTISSERLSALSSEQAIEVLREIRGIGRWTAAVMLLRGLGRLDVFPPGDSGVAANLAALGGSTSAELPSVLEQLGPQRGMLYFYLLLARLAARGQVAP